MPDDRESTLTAVDAAYESLRSRVRGLSEAEGTRPGVVGGWSVAQTLAHMEGWLGEGGAGLQRMARGERATPEGADYSDADAWNAKFVEAHTRPTLGEAVTAFEERFAAFRGALAALPGERFGAGRTANTIALNAWEHFGEHQSEIEKALRG